jgi:diguanylate cyclase (GGDEF)-like protein
MLAHHAHDVLHLAVVDAKQDRGVGLLEKPARAVQPRGPVAGGEQGIDEGAGILVVNYRDDELHAPSIGRKTRQTEAKPHYSVTPRANLVPGPARAVQSEHKPSPAGGYVSGDRPIHARTDGQIFTAAAAAVARGDNLDDQLAELLGLAAEYVGATLGAAYLLDADHDKLELAVTYGIEDPASDETKAVKAASDSHDPLADVVRSRRPLEVDDAGHVAVLRSARTALLLPLVVRRDGIEISLGAMALGFAGPLPTHEVQTGAEPLADLAAVAVERALALSLGSERAEWFDRLAHIDQLTGLANRRTLDRIMDLEVARASRQGVPLSFAIFEIDRFSEIQKTGGNAASDEILRRVAQILAESVRLVDTIARYGNEQFGLVAPGPDGLVVSERLVRGIAALPHVEGTAISVSAGIATFPLDGRTPEELLGVAEKALQSARQAGGGRLMAVPAE